ATTMRGPAVATTAGAAVDCAATVRSPPAIAASAINRSSIILAPRPISVIVALPSTGRGGALTRDGRIIRHVGADDQRVPDPADDTADDGRHPEQPELGQRPSADEERR